MRPPEFWWRDDESRWPTMLGPASWVYERIVRHRFGSAQPFSAGVPVFCVGNLVVGGAGKTPVAMDIGERLLARGVKAHFLSRGYGGKLSGPERVDPQRHSFRDVGDEPMLLAHLSPTWISRDREAGCRAAIADGAEVIVMDDGFQNPFVAKTLSFLVVDTGRGFGNGRVMPAGPLREPVTAGLKRANAVILLGEGGQEVGERVRSIAGTEMPILRARLVPDNVGEMFAGQTVYAFAGIGDPHKFFRSLESLGCRIAEKLTFDDHHQYRRSELTHILAAADRDNAVVVTTSKDAVRLPPDIRERIQVLTIHVEWDDTTALDKIIDQNL